MSKPGTQTRLAQSLSKINRTKNYMSHFSCTCQGTAHDSECWITHINFNIDPSHRASEPYEQAIREFLKQWEYHIQGGLKWKGKAAWTVTRTWSKT